MYDIGSAAAKMIILSLLFAVTVSAGEYCGSFSIPVDKLTISRENGADIFRLHGWAVSSSPGLPELPCTEIHVALPPGARYSGVSVTEIDSYPLSGKFQVRSSPYPQPIGVDDPMLSRQLDPSFGNPCHTLASTTVEPPPEPLLDFVSNWNLVGQNFVSFRLNPFRFDPASGQITVVEEVRFTVTWTDSRIRRATPCNLTERGKELYRGMLARMVINPRDLAFPDFEKHETGNPVPVGMFEHVIITPEQLSGSWSELVAWHNVKGVPDTVITTEWINSNFTGENLKEKIRAFLRHVHEHWGVIWVLLGGDTSLIPHHMVRQFGKNIASDVFYADLNDDYKNELFLGRAPVESQQDVAEFVSRVLTYEKNPPDGSGASALLLGFDIDEWTQAEGMMTDFRENYFPWYFRVAYVYDSDGGDHREATLSWLEAGPNLVNHADMAGSEFLGTGKKNHGLHLSMNDISSLSNGSLLGNFYSVGSFSCGYHIDDCIAEEYLIAPDGGGLTYIGNSNMGWYTPGSTDTYSFLYDRRFIESVFTNGFANIGQAFADSKNSYYPSDSFYGFLWTGLNLLGEPEVPLWLQDPCEPLLGFMPTINSGEQDFTVRVFRDVKAGENALVCIRKPEDGIYQAGLTDSLGSRTFSINPSAGTLFITVSGCDLIPVEETVEVVDRTVLRKGPYSFYPGDNTKMAVAWQLDETRICALNWGRDTTYSEGWVQTVEQSSNHLHGRVIHGLTPGAFYFYRVINGPDEYRGSFRAAPHNSGKTGRIFFYGDTRTFPEMHNMVCERMITDYQATPHIPTIAIHTGDWTSDDSTNAWDNEYFHRDADETRKMLANLPMNGCRGNHDGAGENYKIFWPYPYEDSFYWSFDYGSMHIAIVDQYTAYDPDSPQFDWLKDDLRDSEKTWKLVVYHEPAWAAGGGHENNEEAQAYIHPLCVAFDVPVAIAGHNHYYSRCTVDGIQHVTTAGGGAPLYGCDHGSPYLVAWAKAYHYLSVLADQNTLEVKAIDIFGTVLDSFTVDKSLKN